MATENSPKRQYGPEGKDLKLLMDDKFLPGFQHSYHKVCNERVFHVFPCLGIPAYGYTLCEIKNKYRDEKDVY